MATITVEKRTRAQEIDVWGVWAPTADAPPYTNTTTLEYRVIDESFVTMKG